MKQLTVLLLVATVAAVSAACGGDCAALAEKSLECEKDKMGDMTKSQLEAACELMMSEEETKKEIKAMAKCAKKGSCEEYEACVAGMRADQSADRVAKEASEGKWEDALMSCRINVDEYKANEKLKTACDKVFTEGLKALIDGGKGDEAMSACRYSDDLLAASEVFKTECAKAAGGALEGAKKKAIEFRDKGEDDYGTCSELKELAEKAGGDNVKMAEQMCAEMKAAKDAMAGIKEAKANIAAKKGDIPFACGYAVETFGKMTEMSDWSKKTLTDVLQTCYIDLGKVMIETELPKMRFCPYQIKKLREVVEAQSLKGKDTAFDELLAKTDKHCAK